MYFPIYRLPKTGLDKYLKSAASHYTSTSKLVNVLKYCSDHHGGTIIILFDYHKQY